MFGKVSTSFPVKVCLRLREPNNVVSLFATHSRQKKRQKLNHFLRNIKLFFLIVIFQEHSSYNNIRRIVRFCQVCLSISPFFTTFIVFNFRADLLEGRSLSHCWAEFKVIKTTNLVKKFYIEKTVYNVNPRDQNLKSHLNA